MYLGGHPSSLPEPLRDAFVDENTSVQAEATDVIQDNYYRSVTDARLRDASLRGMVRSLNSRFSHYFTPRENALFRQATSGEFSGVGMTVVEHPRGLRVAGVFDDSPAKRAGIRPGDVITKVNGRSIAGQSSDVSTARIKGKEGTLRAAHGQARASAPASCACGASASACRPWPRSSAAPAASKLGVLELAGFTSGAHGELAQRDQAP